MAKQPHNERWNKQIITTPTYKFHSQVIVYHPKTKNNQRDFDFFPFLMALLSQHRLLITQTGAKTTMNYSKSQFIDLPFLSSYGN